MRAIISNRAVLWIGIALLSLVLCLGPAEAGNKDKMDKAEKAAAKEAEKAEKAAKKAEKKAEKAARRAERKKERARRKFHGGINPTNIAVVDDDLLFSSALIPGTAESQVQAPLAHEVATGRGTTVAILDGGFNLHHPDVADHFAPGYDAIDDDFDPRDDGNGVDEDEDGRIDGGLGHGTFIAGIVLKAAPDTTIVPIRVRDDEGYGTNRALIRGIEYATSLRVDAINLSVEKAQSKNLGIRVALNRAVRRGIVVVLSAGNDGEDTVNAMAKGDGRIAVGAIGDDGRIAEFSNRDASLTKVLMVFAPGVDLYGPLGFPRPDANGWWSGTSFSAGYVTGAVALARELDPGAEPKVIQEWIRESLDPIGEGEEESNFGSLNLLRLVRR